MMLGCVVCTADEEKRHQSKCVQNVAVYRLMKMMCSVRRRGLSKSGICTEESHCNHPISNMKARKSWKSALSDS